MTDICKRPEEVSMYLWRSRKALETMYGSIEQFVLDISNWCDMVVVQVGNNDDGLDWTPEDAAELYVELVTNGIGCEYLWWPSGDSSAILRMLGNMANYLGVANQLLCNTLGQDTTDKPGVCLDAESSSLRAADLETVRYMIMAIDGIAGSFSMTSFQNAYKTRNVAHMAQHARLVEAQAFSHGDRDEDNDGFGEEYGPIGFQKRALVVLDSLNLPVDTEISVALPLWGQDSFKGYTLEEVMAATALTVSSKVHRLAHFRVKYYHKYDDVASFMNEMWGHE